MHWAESHIHMSDCMLVTLNTIVSSGSSSCLIHEINEMQQNRTEPKSERAWMNRSPPSHGKWTVHATQGQQLNHKEKRGTRRDGKRQKTATDDGSLNTPQMDRWQLTVSTKNKERSREEARGKIGRTIHQRELIWDKMRTFYKTWEHQQKTGGRGRDWKKDKQKAEEDRDSRVDSIIGRGRDYMILAPPAVTTVLSLFPLFPFPPLPWLDDDEEDEPEEEVAPPLLMGASEKRAYFVILSLSLDNHSSHRAV